MKLTRILSIIVLAYVFVISLGACGEPASSAATGGVIPDGSAAEINWYTDVDAAKAAARERDTIIMVDVYTDWCHWCKELDKQVYTDQRVVDLSKQIVNLKVNAEDNGQGSRIAGAFGVQGYPTILFMTADEKEVDRIGGFLPPDEFLEAMKGIVSGNGAYSSYVKALEDGALAGDARIDALEKFMLHQDDANAVKVAEALDPASITDERKREKAYLLLTDHNFSRSNFEKAEALLLAYLREFPQSETAPRAYLFVVIANVKQNDLEGARKYLDEMKQKFPDEQQLIAQAAGYVNNVGD